MYENLNVNFQDFPKIISKYPQYTRLLTGLTQIDGYIKNIATDVIETHSDPERYFIKSELNNSVYALSLFDAETKEITKHEWLLEDLLKKCKNKIITIEAEEAIKKMIGCVV